MRLSRSAVGWVAVVGAVCFATACSSLLGLGDFKDAPADAGSTGGGAGTGGTAGTAGTGGAAGKDAGSDAGDAGAFKCSPSGGIFPVIANSDLGGTALQGESLIAVENPDHSQIYVVAMADSKAGVPTIFVRTLTDSLSNHQGPLQTFQPTGTFRIELAYADQSTLHLLGWMNGDLAEVDFAVGGSTSQPALQTLQQNACASGIRSVCYMRDGSTLHEALTCREPGPDGGTIDTLYLDGAFVTSGPDDQQGDVAVQNCALVGSTYVVRTGVEFGDAVIRYGKTAGDLAQGHRFSLTSDPNRGTEMADPVPTPTNDGFLAIGLTFATPPTLTPMYFYLGVMPLTKLGDLDLVPVPELKKKSTINDLNDLMNGSQLDVQPSYVMLASGTMGLGATRLTVMGRDGKMLVFAQDVYTTDPKVSNVVGAAVGVVNASSIVVWAEQNPDTTNPRVRGQVMFCTGPT